MTPDPLSCPAPQVVFHEILCGMWVRNGLQIRGQAMTYIQCHFCNSMVDADLYLLQVRGHSVTYFQFTTNETSIGDWKQWSSTDIVYLFSKTINVW